MESPWKGLSGMDAARAAMGQGWPFAACPWNGDGANEPGAKRRAGWRASPLVPFGATAKGPPAGGTNARSNSETIRAGRSNAWKRHRVFHPTLRRISQSAHTTHPAQPSPTPSPPEPSGHPDGSPGIRDETACPPSPARTVAPAALPSVRPRSTADSSCHTLRADGGRDSVGFVGEDQPGANVQPRHVGELLPRRPMNRSGQGGLRTEVDQRVFGQLGYITQAEVRAADRDEGVVEQLLRHQPGQRPSP